MKNKLHDWLVNASIHRKFLPLQIFVILLMALISVFSINSVTLVNNLGENIITNNVASRESLNDIITTMYTCRVLGRDILLQTDEAETLNLYDEYLKAFEDLDRKMEEFSKNLKDDKLEDFNNIIEEKNIYKESMILSADIKIEGGSFEEALYALTVVTPIAEQFFQSINTFLSEEEVLMGEALKQNNSLVTMVLAFTVASNILFIIALIAFVKFFARHVNSSLISLEKAVLNIADTGDMRIEIPDHLYTRDEIGRIAAVVDNLRGMLLVHAFTDVLTGGYNAKAYDDELYTIFKDTDNNKMFWCVISDMNGLKQINDTLGHIEGDSAIRKIYGLLHENFEFFGRTFRIGGDEFVSILFNCSKENVEQVVSMIHAQAKELNKNASGPELSVAIGYGMFTGETREDFEEFFKVIDKEMYDDKQKRKKSLALANDLADGNALQENK